MKVYKNTITPNNDSDLSDEELEILIQINEKAKKLLINQASDKIAYFMMMWLKYYRLDNTTYDNLARSFLESNIFLLEDINPAIEKSKKVLKEKYKINIESLNPLVLYSNVPFNQIKERI